LNTGLDGGLGGTFDLTEPCTLLKEYPISVDTIINGGGYTIYAPGSSAGNPTGGTARHFTVNPGITLTLNNVTLTGGYSTSYGGAIFNDGGTVAVTNSTLRDNKAVEDYNILLPTYDWYGGAIFNDGGTVNVTGSTLRGNSATLGGNAIFNNMGAVTVTDSLLSDNIWDYKGYGSYGSAIYNSGSDVLDEFGDTSGTATLSVTNSTLSGNSVGDGGAIYNTDGPAYTSSIATVTVTDSILSGNTGGAIYNENDNGGTTTVTVINSTLSDNSGTVGGAIHNMHGNPPLGTATVTVTNSTLSGNSATHGGGAIYNSNGEVTVTNSTLRGNTEPEGLSGAIYNTVHYFDEDSIVNVTNSIIAGGGCANNKTLNDNGGNITTDDTCPGTTVADLVLGPLQDNGGPTWTHALLVGSPALDNPDATCVVATDQRHIARPLTTGCDSGAYEARKQITVVLSGYGNVTGGPGGIDCSTAPDDAEGIGAGTTCFASFDTSTEVTLTALADFGSVFIGWSGDGVDCGAALTCTVLVEAEQTVTAAFAFAEAVAPEFGDPYLCDAINFVGGWGIFAEGTPAGTAYTVPAPPEGYSFVAQPYYDGYCDVFVINQDHSPLPVQVCWPVGTHVVPVHVGLYHDQPDLSRAWAILPTTQQGESVCASLPALGGVALLSGGLPASAAPAAVAVPVEPAQMAVDCQVTTTHAIIFRDAPNGADIGRVMYETTLHATAESTTDGTSAW
ncbi:choice-of-anchor Q domain-containing protein, partial [Chloroflexota bacterium]